MENIIIIVRMNVVRRFTDSLILRVHIRKIPGSNLSTAVYGRSDWFIGLYWI